MINEKYKKPPRADEWLLKKIFPDSGKYTSLGDFEEEYIYILEKYGRNKARLWYRKQVFKSLSGFIKNRMYWRSAMFKNYIKIAYRNILKQKAYTFINLSGLAVGMACAILILMYIQFEFSYDRYHKNADRIFRVDIEFLYKGKIETTYRFTNIEQLNFIETIPEITNIVKTNFMSSVFFTHRDKGFFEKRIYFADPSIFKVFTLPFLKGNPETALNSPNSIVLSERMAAKYFGDEDPVGKHLTFASGALSNYYNFGTYEFTVTGVLENTPENSTYKYDFLSSISGLKSILSNQKLKMNSVKPYTYFLRIQKDYPPEELEEKLRKYMVGYVNDPDNALDRNLTETFSKGKIILQPLTGIHLNNSTLVKILYIFSVIAAAILLIACINYMNLSTARYAKRFREVGLKKAVGANRMQLISQFLGESIFLAFISLILALIFVQIFLPYFNSVVGLQLKFSLFNNLFFYGSLMLLTMIVGFVSGSYPSFFLSSFKPMDVIRNTGINRTSRFSVRKILVISQFIISIVLIIGTIIVTRQLHFMKNTNLGFDKENIIVIEIKERDFREKFPVVKNEFLKINNVITVSTSESVPVQVLPYPNKAKIITGDGEQEKELILESIDRDFIETYGISLISGKMFPEMQTGKYNFSFLINEMAVKELNLHDPIGTIIDFDFRKGEVIGVVKDFNLFSKHYKSKPVVLYVYPRMHRAISIKIKPENRSETIEFMKHAWRKFSPDRPMVYYFFEDIIDAEYESENRLGKIFTYFSVIGIVIAALGLFGLVSYMAEQRTREIGIRKVLGATVPGIVSLIMTEFIRSVVIANLIAWPLAWIFMNKWLENFAYRSKMGIWLFLSTGLVTIIIAIFTVSYQSIKAARANPVDSLKYE